MVKTVLPLQGPLVGKLRSHMLHGVAKKEETTHIFTGHKCHSWIFLSSLHSEPKLNKLSQNLDFKLILKKKKKNLLDLAIVHIATRWQVGKELSRCYSFHRNYVPPPPPFPPGSLNSHCIKPNTLHSVMPTAWPPGVMCIGITVEEKETLIRRSMFAVGSVTY